MKTQHKVPLETKLGKEEEGRSATFGHKKQPKSNIQLLQSTGSDIKNQFKTLIQLHRKLVAKQMTAKAHTEKSEEKSIRGGGGREKMKVVAILVDIVGKGVGIMEF